MKFFTEKNLSHSLITKIDGFSSE
jgi:hypothetical protein